MKTIINLLLLVAVAHVSVGCASMPDQLENSNVEATADAVTAAIENCMAEGKTEEECQAELFNTAEEEAQEEYGNDDADGYEVPVDEDGEFSDEELGE